MAFDGELLAAVGAELGHLVALVRHIHDVSAWTELWLGQVDHLISRLAFHGRLKLVLLSQKWTFVQFLGHRSSLSLKASVDTRLDLAEVNFTRHRGALSERRLVLWLV